MERIIPARIIQTGRTRDLPLFERAALANLRSLNPGFEYRFFDNRDVDDFVRVEFPEYQAVFESFPYPIQKYDFFRYLAVYRLGGFYFDLDVFFAKGLDDLLVQRCVFPFEELTLNRFLRREYGMDWEIANYAFGAAPREPFLKAVIENCVRAQREPGWVAPMMQHIPLPFRKEFHVLNTTGPGLVTRTLAENPALQPHVKVLFPSDVCDEEHWHQFGDYGVHLMQGSWRENGGFLRRRFAHFWESRARRRLRPESLALGKTRPVNGASRAVVACA